ncbi:putative EF-hand calcium-binding domain protein [Aspergillus mulundensis]|uniref:Serine hydrolase domain-containing protein n=1 Tax=Aspergillus mulundensis TaxID=1810919 RepID=A0A3D8RKD6_9EURO|nr:hypothetical protein DSM5745_07070 [Aspergillus mulundensis]RDW74408.1 hypothetical protein DSM5745_07070 [Aspergillus mulundensis]
MKPKLKVLCLHGRGTSGVIFKSQTASIRSRLTDLNLSFDFVDGPYPAAPAPGIDLFYTPPYYTFYPESAQPTTIETIRSTQKWLAGIIAERGPYDLVMTFSQGASVVAETLLMHEYDYAQSQQDSLDGESNSPPFKAAIFICGGAPLTLMSHIGYTIPEITKARDLASRATLAQMASSEAILSKGSARWSANSHLPNLDMNPGLGLGHSLFNLNPYPSPTSDMDDNNINTLQLTFNKEDEIRREISGPHAYPSPSPTADTNQALTAGLPRRSSDGNGNGNVKITIPTVHIYGERDPRYIAGIQLSEVCEKSSRKVYNHGGGHEIPRFEAVSGAMADLVRWAVRAAERRRETEDWYG